MHKITDMPENGHIYPHIYPFIRYLQSRDWQYFYRSLYKSVFGDKLKITDSSDLCESGHVMSQGGLFSYLSIDLFSCILVSL